MAEVTPESILAASAAEVAEAMQQDAQTANDPAAVAQTATEATATTAPATNGTANGAAAAEGTVAAAAETNGTHAAAGAAASATPSAAAAAAASATTPATPPRPFNFKWLKAADRNRQHFADELFNTTFSQENVERVVQELKTVTANKIASSHRLCEDDHIYSVQITAHGSLRIPTHLMRIELPYSVLTEDSAVCLFVRDLKKPPPTVGRTAKSATLADLTVRHYEQLLAAANIDTAAVTIMPLSQLYNEHYSLDQRRKLTYLYDKFIVEAPVAAAVNAFLGAKLLYDGRAAFPVDLRADDLAAEWDVVLRQVFYQSHQAAEHLAAKPYICVGRQSHDVAQVAENIIDLLGQLGTLQPGGAPNVSALYLRASGNVATAVQLYKDPATSAPEIPEPEADAAAVAQADGSTPAESAEILTVKVPNLTQHIIDSAHYIVFDGEDDYTEEFGADQPPRLTLLQQRHGAAGGETPNRRQPLQNQYQQQQQQQQHPYNAQQQRANGARQVAATVQATGNGGNSSVDELVLRGLQKLLNQQNLGHLVAGMSQGNGGNVRRQQQQQNGGPNNGGGYVARRSGNMQMQQQQQQLMGRNQMAGGYVQRRRNVNQINGMNNGPQRNNRRFI